MIDFSRLRLFAFSALAALAVALSGCTNPLWHTHEKAPGGVPLTGRFDLAIVDDAPYARPPADSPLWQKAFIGPEGLEGDLDITEGVGWAVIEFDVEDPARYPLPALLVTYPPDAEEYYLNGTLVGKAGRISKYYEAVPSGPRYLEFTNSALKKGHNELAIKVLFAGQNIRDFDGPIYLGSEIDMNLAWDPPYLKAVTTEAVFLSFYITALILFAFIFTKNTDQTEYLLFIVFLTLRIMHLAAQSHFIIDNGLTQDWFVVVRRAVFPLLSATMLLLIAAFSRAGLQKLDWLFLAGCAGFSVAELFTPPLAALGLFSLPYKVFMFVLAVYFLLLSIRMVVSKKDEAWPLMIGVIAYSIGSRFDLLLGTEYRNYAITAFSLCMFYALASRHARLNARLNQLSNKLLDAHEEERHRLARDIHDGVGQSVLGLKLKLQMLGEKTRREPGSVDAEAFLELAADTSTILDEVRRTARDLRPAFVENVPLADALEWYAESALKDSRIDFYFHRSELELLDPPLRVKDNIYRIFQEILANALKHSGASRIDVTLFMRGKVLTLLATDNGVGFVRSRSPAGLGLMTMGERAELLGGVCTVESNVGHGTTVSVEVPLP